MSDVSADRDQLSRARPGTHGVHERASPGSGAVHQGLSSFAVLILSLLLAYSAAALGGLASIEASSFYELLRQPAWAPPSWLFGPAWTLLYTMMAVAAWLLWRRGPWRVMAVPLGLYLLHLPVNALWSWTFFVGRSGLWATLHILVLLAMILALVVLSWSRRRAAALLLMPYLAWVSYATMLCVVLWWLNPALL